jgi:DNA-binding transcriptional regulator GbsR (MarR family)
MSYQKGNSKKFAIVAAYSYVRENIDQKTLQEITGFSRGTISTILQKLVNDNILQKKYNKETRQFTYENKGTLSSTLGGSLTNFQDTFPLMLEKLNETEKKLNIEEMKTKLGFDNLQDFISEMKILMPAYQHIMKKYQSPNSSS